MARRRGKTTLPNGTEIYLQSLTNSEFMRCMNSEESTVLLAATYSITNDVGHTLYAPSKEGVDELVDELCEDDAANVNALMGHIQEFVFGEGSEKKASIKPISLPSESPEHSIEPTPTSS